MLILIFASNFNHAIKALTCLGVLPQEFASTTLVVVSIEQPASTTAGVGSPLVLNLTSTAELSDIVAHDAAATALAIDNISVEDSVTTGVPGGVVAAIATEHVLPVSITRKHVEGAFNLMAHVGCGVELQVATTHILRRSSIVQGNSAANF